MKAMSHDNNDSDDVDEENDDSGGHGDGSGSFDDNQNYNAITPMTFQATYKLNFFLTFLFSFLGPRLSGWYNCLLPTDLQHCPWPVQG